MSALNGPVSAARFREFFGVQLRFAEALASKGVLSLTEAITFYTNVHRRFAYGNLKRQEPSSEFAVFVERLAKLEDHEARLDFAVAEFANRPVLGPPPGTTEFGCFRCEAPDGDGRVRIHFANQDTTGDVGPLHHSKVARRRAELASMVTFLTQTWGQFLDFRGATRPAMRDAFLARLGSERFDPERRWTVFALPRLTTNAPFASFQREYAGSQHVDDAKLKPVRAAT